MSTNGLRHLLRRPLFFSMSVFILALGMGATYGILSIIDDVRNKSLAYRDASQLLLLEAHPVGHPSDPGLLSWADLQKLKREVGSIDVGAFMLDSTLVRTPLGTRKVLATHLTPTVFEVLGVHPLKGRPFMEGDVQNGAAPTVIISSELKDKLFDGQSQVIGQSMDVGGVRHTVIGVMANDMRFPETAGGDAARGIWLPLVPSQEMIRYPSFTVLNVIARSHVRDTPGQIEAFIGKTMEHSIAPGVTSRSWNVTPMLEVVTRASKPALTVLLTSASMLLLIACLNVAQLLVIQAVVKRKEVAVRVALGASVARVVREVLLEAALLALLGAAMSLLFAYGLIVSARHLPSGVLPRQDMLSLHWQAAVLVCLCGAGTVLISSIVPALISIRGTANDLRGAISGVMSSPKRSRLFRMVVTLEVALTVVLFVSANALLLTAWKFIHQPLGFSTDNVTTMQITPPDAAGFLPTRSGAAKGQSLVAEHVYVPVLERVRQMPMVIDATVATASPLSTSAIKIPFILASFTPRDYNPVPLVSVRAIGSNYFRTLGIPVQSGRPVSDSDVVSSPFVAVVNNSFARRWFPNRPALGMSVNLGGTATGMVKEYSIVGVVGDTQRPSAIGQIEPELYLPIQQVPETSLFYALLVGSEATLIVHHKPDTDFASVVPSLIDGIASGATVENVIAMKRTIEDGTYGLRLELYITGCCALFSVVLVIGGLVAIMSRAASSRRREIALRMALGDSKVGTALLLLRDAMLPLLIGQVAGVIVAICLGRLALATLHGISTATSTAYVLALGMNSALSLWAMAMPALQASNVNPAQLLRED